MSVRDILQLHLLTKLGPIRGRRALQTCGNASAVLGASDKQLAQIPSMTPQAARAIRESTPDQADKELDLATRNGLRVIGLQDAEYPAALKEIPDAPLCLIVGGGSEALQRTAIAMVGSRRCTFYGSEQAYTLGMALARCGVTVVSGLAEGIDHRAHEAALDCKGTTVAVVACGHGRLRRHVHARTAAAIMARGGAVISEHPHDHNPTAGCFPRRNRIIAGLCVGTLVVEAALRSGALITARLATEYDREVFAVPGRADTPTAFGTNRLIQGGLAKLVMSLPDILDELHHVLPELHRDHADHGQAVTRTTRLEPQEQTLLKHITGSGVSLEQLCQVSDWPPGRIAQTLITLELKGLVAALPGNRFARRYAADDGPKHEPSAG